LQVYQFKVRQPLFKQMLCHAFCPVNISGKTKSRVAGTVFCKQLVFGQQGTGILRCFTGRIDERDFAS